MDQLNHTCGTDRPLMKANEPNILIKCIKAVLPLIGSSCLDVVEKDMLENSIGEYKVTSVCVYLCVFVCLFVCVCVCVYHRVTCILYMYINRGVLLKTKLRRILQNI